MRFSTFSHKGSRTQNCDRVEKIIQDGMCAFILADGGDFCGDIAAELICTTATDELKKDLRVDSAILSKCFEATQKTITEKAEHQEGFKNICASCAILLFDKDKAIWGHIGNCRVYCLKNSKVISVTDDHTEAYKKFSQNEIKYNDIAKLDNGMLLISINAKNTIGADVSDIKKIGEQHSFLVCSDGFWKNIDIEAIQDFKKESDGTKTWLSSMLSVIEKRAKADCDSISAAAISMK